MARRLAERRFEHPLVSASLDLDPAVFATAGARSSEISSLLDRARGALRPASVDHHDRVALEHDIERVESYLRDELDPSGARGVTIYCSSRAELFEALALPWTVGSEVAIEPLPHLEPLLPGPERRRCAVALVNRREARFFTPSSTGGLEWRDFEDPVHGQHHAGGWSESNYERSVESGVDAHLRRSAKRLYWLLQHEPFDVLLLGGPHELLARFTAELHPDVAALLDPAELALDLSAVAAADVETALEDVRERWGLLAQQEALGRIASALDGRAGVAAGPSATLAALAERRVESLVLAPGFDAPGARCPACELVYGAAETECQADGVPLDPLTSIRSAIVRAAVLQDARLIVLDRLDDRAEIAAFDGIGALLRY